MSSAWRQNRSVADLKDVFNLHKFAEKIFDKTADNIYVKDEETGYESSLNRAEEVDVWLQQNKLKLDISNFVIFDDEDSGFTDLFKDHFVQCKNGTIDQENLEEAISKINEDPILDINKHPINNLNLTIINRSANEDPLCGNELLRVTSNQRRKYVTNFFNKKTAFNTTNCVNLIADYDTGELPKKEGCTIM